ncbi:MAG: class I SAM-dependent rRNA methyltransferase [Ignavibacteriaceae bacterium]
MEIQSIALKPKKHLRVENGHPWIFSDEIAGHVEEIPAGELVRIITAEGKEIGYGFYNRHSLISVRFISETPVENFYEFFRKRIRKAIQFRKEIYPDRTSLRIVHSESDFLPGLIIDKYNDTYVLQVNSAGIEKNIDVIIEVLKDELGAKNIFTSNNFYFRRLEGLTESDSVYEGNVTTEIISDGEITYTVNFQESQKTGFYFDQHENRKTVQSFASGKTVLDCFCNSGGFGLHAAKGGAAKVIFIDSSLPAVENAKQNFMNNKFTCEPAFIHQEVFSYLADCARAGIKFDLIVLDPPAFARGKKDIHKAGKAYRKLNRIALGLLADGGYLFTASCSHHIDRESFRKILFNSVKDSGKYVQLIHFAGASPDHPVLVSMPESEYLKFAVLRKAGN